jgi:hypothetical protein
MGVSAECLTESIFPEGTRGTSCARTSLRQPLRSFSTAPGLSEFASALYAAASSSWHEASSRRFRLAPR